MTSIDERVRAASAAWVWVPEDAEVIETDDYRLVRQPAWVGDLELQRFSPTRPGAETDGVDEVLAAARATGLPELVWWVKLDSPPGVEKRVRALGGVPDLSLDVLAADLTGPVALDPPTDVELRWALDAEVLHDSFVVMAAAFGMSMPPEERIAGDAALAPGKHERGEGSGLVAYLDDEPVGTGGVTVAGDVARLWSGSVVERARGRGVYRALLAARLEYAVARGATLGLVKGRVTTSGPILRRAGFEAFGQERSYLLVL